MSASWNPDLALPGFSEVPLWRPDPVCLQLRPVDNMFYVATCLMDVLWRPFPGGQVGPVIRQVPLYGPTGLLRYRSCASDR